MWKILDIFILYINPWLMSHLTTDISKHVSPALIATYDSWYPLLLTIKMVSVYVSIQDFFYHLELEL